MASTACAESSSVSCMLHAFHIGLMLETCRGAKCAYMPMCRGLVEWVEGKGGRGEEGGGEEERNPWGPGESLILLISFEKKMYHTRDNLA